MATVTLEFDEQNWPVTSLCVSVDGERVGGGEFHGEPEDNLESRDYSWVRPLVRALSEKLGATVVDVSAGGL